MSLDFLPVRMRAKVTLSQRRNHDREGKRKCFLNAALSALVPQFAKYQSIMSTSIRRQKKIVRIAKSPEWRRETLMRAAPSKF